MLCANFREHANDDAEESTQSRQNRLYIPGRESSVPRSLAGAPDFVRACRIIPAWKLSGISGLRGIISSQIVALGKSRQDCRRLLQVIWAEVLIGVDVQ